MMGEETGTADDLVVERQLIGSGDPGNQILLANDEYALGKSRHFGADLLHPFDDQRPGSAAVHLEFGESVHVRVVPIQARRLSRPESEC